MILKGSVIRSIPHARKMAVHLFKDENEVIRVQDSFDGVGDLQDVENTLVELQLYSRITKGSTAVFSVAISPREDESLSPEQKQEAIRIIEEEFGLQGQVRFEVDHEKDGRWHSHQLWSLVNQEEQKLIDVRNYKQRLVERAREMEHAFEHEVTASHVTDTTIEVSNADRMRQTKSRPAVQRKREISQIWNNADTIEDFMYQMSVAGYALAKGHKASVVVLDHDGQAYNLTRELPKAVKAKDVLARFGDVQPELQDVDQAREIQIRDLQQFDRDQQEIVQQNRMLDAAESAAKLQHQLEQKAKATIDQTKKGPEIQASLRRPPEKLPQNPIILPSNDHLVRLDLQRRWDAIAGQRKKEFDKRVEQQRQLLRENEHRIKELQTKLSRQSRVDKLRDLFASKRKQLQEDLAAQQKSYEDHQQRMPQEESKFTRMIEDQHKDYMKDAMEKAGQKPSYSPPEEEVQALDGLDDQGIVDLEAKREEIDTQDDEDFKHQQREWLNRRRQRDREEDRDMGFEI